MSDLDQLSKEEAQKKLEEKKQLIERLVHGMAEVFEQQIPLSIMNTEESGVIMHNATLNLLMRLSHALGYNRQTIIAHINMFFNEVEGIKPS